MQYKNLRRSIIFGSLLTINSMPAFSSAKIEIDDTKWISVGVGIRTSFRSVSDAAPNNSRSNDFELDNARLYIAGQLSEDFKLYFGTDRVFGKYDVIDAIAQYEPDPAFNVWAGRHLTPADRIEMNGPFYSLSGNQFTVPLFPSDNDPQGSAGIFGRDEGVTIWGTLNKFQYAVGVFDGFSGAANRDDSVLYAARFEYNFLDVENNPAYYTSSTYFGKGGDIFTVGLSGQYQNDGYGTNLDSASFGGYVVDFLFEKPLSGGAAVTVEGEYKVFNVSSFTPSAGSVAGFSVFDGDAYFVTAGYLIGQPVGPGQIQPYVRYTENSPSTGASSDLYELGMNYVIQGHNLKFNLNYTSGDASLTGVKGDDVDTVFLGLQFQI